MFTIDHSLRYQSLSSRRALSLALVESIEPRRLLSASTLDTSFNGSGSAFALLGDTTSFTAVTVLPDGKTLAAGRIDLSPGQATNYDFVVARFTAAGKLDLTFGGGDGWVSTAFPAFSSGVAQDVASAIVQLPGGKFAVAGTTSSNFDRQGNFAVARYNADGKLDTSFSGDGLVTTDFGVNSDDEVYAMAVTSDGKLLVVGKADNIYRSDSMNVAAARYNANGSLDASFSGDGKMESDAGTAYGSNPSRSDDDRYANQAASAVSILPDGRFLIAGSTIDAPNSSRDPHPQFYLSQFTVNGSLDTSFGGGKGYVRIDTGTQDAEFSSIAALANGKFLAGGTQGISNDAASNAHFAVARFNANGSKDTTFGSAGFATASFTEFGTADDSVRSVLAQPTGKIYLVGSSTPRDMEHQTQIAIARFSPNGAIDNSFSGNGKQLNGAIDGPAEAVLDGGGRIVVAGLLTGNAGAIARFGVDTATTAQISGTFYNDKNHNGVKEASDPAMHGWQAFVDSNNDGFYTPGEQIAAAGSTGIYHLVGLAPGTYRIREVRLDGWNRSQPSGVYPLGYWDVTVGIGQSVTGKHFGNWK